MVRFVQTPVNDRVESVLPTDNTVHELGGESSIFPSEPPNVQRFREGGFGKSTFPDLGQDVQGCFPGRTGTMCFFPSGFQ